jgi:hypothetical protein
MFQQHHLRYFVLHQQLMSKSMSIAYRHSVHLALRTQERHYDCPSREEYNKLRRYGYSQLNCNESQDSMNPTLLI